MGNAYTLDELQKKKEYQKAYYERKKANNEKRQHKLYKKSLEEKHKGFVFDFDGKIVSLEVKLPFRIMKFDIYGNKHCDENKYAILQNELKRKLFDVDKSRTITIIECGYLQFFTSNLANIDACCETIKAFIKEQLEIYGQYTKRGYKVGKDFLDGNQ